MLPLFSPMLKRQLRQKELGVGAHLLDGAWFEAPRSVILTLALGAGLMYFEGRFSLFALIVALLGGQLVSIARGISNFLEARHNARIFDSLRVQSYLQRALENSGDCVIAVRRGTAWMVIDPLMKGAEAMSQYEYAQFRARNLLARLPINELRITQRKIASTRLENGKIFAPEVRDLANTNFAFMQPNYSPSKFLAFGCGFTEEAKAVERKLTTPLPAAATDANPA